MLHFFPRELNSHIGGLELTCVSAEPVNYIKMSINGRGAADKEMSREIVYIVHISIIRAPDVKCMEVVCEAEDGRRAAPFQ